VGGVVVVVVVVKVSFTGNFDRKIKIITRFPFLKPREH